MNVTFSFVLVCMTVPPYPSLVFKTCVRFPAKPCPFRGRDISYFIYLREGGHGEFFFSGRVFSVLSFSSPQQLHDFHFQLRKPGNAAKSAAVGDRRRRYETAGLFFFSPLTTTRLAKAGTKRKGKSSGAYFEGDTMA